jgi:hypothetical protein
VPKKAPQPLSESDQEEPQTEEELLEAEERKKCMYILKGTLRDIISNKRIWMGCAGNYVQLTTQFCTALFGSVIYFDQER